MTSQYNAAAGDACASLSSHVPRGADGGERAHSSRSSVPPGKLTGTLDMGSWRRGKTRVSVFHSPSRKAMRKAMRV